MRIEVSQFGGIRPTVNATALAKNEAQRAENCKIRSGAITPLAGGLPSATPPAFSFKDEFGEWTCPAGRLLLDGSPVDQKAPDAPTVDKTDLLHLTDDVTIDVHSTTATGYTTGEETGTLTHTAQISTLDSNGDTILVGTTANPGFIPTIKADANTGAITAVTRVASIKVGTKVYTNPDDTGEVGTGGVGTLRLLSVSLSPVTVTWKKDSDGEYRMYVSGWTALFTFKVEVEETVGEERSAVYRITNVEDSGMETPASDSVLAIVKANQFVTLKGLNASKKTRIYRASGNVISATYRFVAEVEAATFTDTVSDADLGNEMPDVENPPATLTQVVYMPGYFLAGFYTENGASYVAFSEPFFPYWWNSDNVYAVEGTIVGIIANGNDLVVLTDPPRDDDTNAKNYVFTGTAPDAMNMSALQVNQGCVSRNSICRVGSTIGFNSKEGFVLIAGGTGKVVTEPFYNRALWETFYGTAASVVKEYDNQIVIFSSPSTGQGVILDYLNGTMRTFTASGAGNFTWQSKIFELPEPVEMHVMQMEGSGAATITVYGDNDAVMFTEAITAGTDFRIPRTTGTSRQWSFQIVGNGVVSKVSLIHRERIEVNGPMNLTKAQAEGSWRGLMFKFPTTGRFKVVRVRASDYDVTADFYRGSTLDSENTLEDDAEFRLTKKTDNDLWEVDITATGEVYELMLVPRIVRIVDGPVVLRNLQHLRGHLFHFPNAGSFKVGRVRGADGNPSGSLNFYVDEVDTPATLAVPVSTDADFRITEVNAAELVEVEFVPTDQKIQVDEILLIPRTVQTVTGPVVLTKAGRMSWRGTVVQFPRSGTFKVYRSRGPGTVTATLNLYADEAGTATKTILDIANDADARIESLAPNNLWEIEVIPAGELDEFILWPQAEQETNSPVIHVARAVSQGPATWLAQEFRYQEPVRMRTAIVKSRAYPVTLTVYCDGAQVAGSPFTVADAKEFRLNLPAAIGRVWEFDVAVSGVIDSVTMFAETIQDVDVAAFYLKYDGVKGNISTLARVMRFRRDECFNCAKVQASAYPVTLKLYRDYAKTPTYTAQVVNSSGFRLPKIQPARTWEIDAIPKDTATIIHSVALAKSMAALRV